jgi:hypothetical protein
MISVFLQLDDFRESEIRRFHSTSVWAGSVSNAFCLSDFFLQNGSFHSEAISDHKYSLKKIIITISGKL